ncbi:TetR/AcrR family transcriptional regulator [Motiliproteus sp.]|uniref:TetR/AcrR family transcriptional regulator n=1 Tax=Motiliproteus sp. TaxID=1898955 RepID=UPI003BA954BF
MEPKRSRSEIKRQAILDAAKQAFLDQGVQGTSMDRVATLAEVSKRTVYNHFESKEALVMCLISELWQQAKHQRGGDYQPDAPLHGQLRAIIEAEIEVISSTEHIELNRVAFGHFFYHPEALKQEVTKLSAHESSLVRWIKAARADGRLIDLEAAAAGEQVHHLVKGRCFWPQLLQIAPILNPEQQLELAEQTTAMFLSHYQAASLED